MNRKIKKILSVIMCVVMLFTTASVAFAADETERTVVDSGFCGAQGENLTWTLYDDGELVISGEGEMDWYDPNHRRYTPWNDYYNRIDVITVEEGVTSIGYEAFTGDGGVTYTRFYKINLPRSLQFVEGAIFTDIYTYRVPGQHLAYSYAGSEEEWSKVGLKIVRQKLVDSVWTIEYTGVIVPLGLPDIQYSKVYFNGEEPEAFCEIVTDDIHGYDLVAHYYSSEIKAEKLLWYSVHNGKDRRIAKMNVGEYDVDEFIIPTHITGKHELRVDVVDAEGETIVSSENFLLSNVPSLGKRIKSFFETFAYMANLLGYLISMSLASELAIIRNWFVSLFN